MTVRDPRMDTEGSGARRFLRSFLLAGPVTGTAGLGLGLAWKWAVTGDVLSALARALFIATLVPVLFVALALWLGVRHPDLYFELPGYGGAERARAPGIGTDGPEGQRLATGSP